MGNGTIVFISAPPGGGKRLLVRAVHALRQDLVLRMQGARLNIYTDRPRHAGEKPDKRFHFVSAQEMSRICADPDFFAFRQEGHWSAYDLKQLAEIQARKTAVCLEKIDASLIVRLNKVCGIRGINIRTVFLTPFTGKWLTEVYMAGGIESVRKLVNGHAQDWLLMEEKKHPSQEKLRRIEREAATAFAIMGFAKDHTHILLNRPDLTVKKTMDPFTWTDPRALVALADILEGNEPLMGETGWPEHIFTPV